MIYIIFFRLTHQIYKKGISYKKTPLHARELKLAVLDISDSQMYIT